MKTPFKTVFVISVLSFLIVLWGILAITASQAASPHPLFLAGKQLGFALMGGVGLFAAAKIPFEKHEKWRHFYAIFALLFLWGVLLFGVRINGMRGWYEFGGCFLQPSEIGKGIFVLLLAGCGAQFRKSAWWGAMWILPILLQPDFGTAAVYGGGFLCMWISGGGSWKVLWGMLTACVAGAALFIRCNAYAWKRLCAFWNPEADPEGGGWHIRQFQMAIAHGEWTGAKLGQTFWSSEYLPLAYNDSVYAAMSETLGFFGSLAGLALYAGLYIVLLRQAMRRDLRDQARLYIAGAGAILAVQTLLHAGVNVGLLPPTGLTLPLASYGGSSMIGTMVMIGIACSAASCEDRGGTDGFFRKS